MRGATKMNTQILSKAICRVLFAAAVATTATFAANAASRYWTGASDTIWDNTGNWEGGNSPGNDEVYFQNNKFDSKFTGESGSVITFTNSFSVWRTRLRGAGSEQAPLVLRAADSESGLDFGTSVGIIVADSSGSGYLRIESGTYPISVGIRIGETYQGGLTVTGGAVLKAKNGNMDIQNGKVVLDDGTIEISKTDKYVSLGNQANGCELHLENGGLLTTSLIWDGDKGKTSTVLFNGGTLKANGVFSTSWPAIIADKENITVNVGANGGTIDASGFNIQVARPIAAADGANDGGMTFKGGGSVSLKYANTYTGVTTVEVGTTLVVPEAIAGEKLAFTIPEAGREKGVYEVVRISGSSVFADSVLTDATKPVDASAQFWLNSAKTSIICVYGYAPGEVAYIGGSGGSLSVADNWTTGVVPTRGEVMFDFAAATTLIVGDTFRADTITISDASAVVTIGAGDLHLSGSLTNANKLAIASGATLTVDGDLVAFNGQGTFLYSNEGTVTVEGNAVCSTAGTATTTKQYEVVTENTQPIQAAGLLYNIVQSGRIFWRLESNSTGAGAWVVGENGLKFINPEDRSSTRFYAQDNPVTLYSSADWKLANTGKSSTSNGDLQVYGNSSLTIDTTDYTDKTTPRIVTLEGRIKADGNVTIAGSGTVVVATSANPSGLTDTTVASGKTIAVTNTATLKVNAGKKILGEGTISLGAGTTLALDSGALGTVGDEGFTPCIPGLALPAEGTATLRIDGNRLKSGDHEIANVASDTTANVALDSDSVALDGRKGTLRVEDSKLILNIQPGGLAVIIR